jgi:hypothetical protein
MMKTFLSIISTLPKKKRRKKLIHMRYYMAAILEKKRDRHLKDHIEEISHLPKKSTGVLMGLVAGNSSASLN